MKVLMSMPWKGNVRELDNVIEHAMIVGEDAWICVADLPSRIARNGSAESVVTDDDLKGAMRVYERSHISNVLDRLEGDKRAAAEQLGISLSSLYRKIDELGLATNGEG
jgi:transcriptional regulator with PAS, ATPase and Fis domain